MRSARHEAELKKYVPNMSVLRDRMTKSTDARWEGKRTPVIDGRGDSRGRKNCPPPRAVKKVAPSSYPMKRSWHDDEDAGK